MRWDTKLVLLAAWTAVGTCGYLIVPTAAPFLLPLAAIAPILWYPEKGLWRHLWSRSLLARILAVASAYLLINATWSTAPALAYIGVATFFVASVVLHIVNSTVPFLERTPVRAMAVGFYAGFAICALLLSVEIALGHPIHLYVFAQLPTLAPQISEAVIESNVVKSLPSHFLNRHIAALTFLIWPAALIAKHLSRSRGYRAVLLLCLAPTVVAVFASDHETSKIAFAGGAAMFCLQLLASRLAKPLLAATWIIACVAVVPLSAMLYELQFHKAAWLQSSAQHRIVIWGVTSSKIAEAPILGHGLVSARELGQREKERPIYAPGSPFLVSPGPHAHNVYLQVWFDTGLVGVALMLGIGLFVVRAIGRAAADHQPELYAAFATNAVLAASSFSIWTRWFLASFALSAIFGMLASRFATSAHPEDSSKQDTTKNPAWPGTQAVQPTPDLLAPVAPPRA